MKHNLCLLGKRMFAEELGITQLEPKEDVKDNYEIGANVRQQRFSGPLNLHCLLT